MTALSDLKAITITANAKSTGAKAGTDLNALIIQGQRAIGELQVILKQIIAIHPTGGADATVLTALQSVLSELV